MQDETKNRFFLVVVDETEELHQALHFACARAKSINANIALVYVITPNEFGHFQTPLQKFVVTGTVKRTANDEFLATMLVFSVLF
mgnify:CR=1 FL=1